MQLEVSIGPVAQLVEQGTFNPKVTGSIPVRPINTNPQNEKGSPAWASFFVVDDILLFLPQAMAAHEHANGYQSADRRAGLNRVAWPPRLRHGADQHQADG